MRWGLYKTNSRMPPRAMTYGTANPAWLTEYDNDRSFWIRVGGAAGDIQRRNAAGTGWENVTGLVSGKDGGTGPVGPQSRFAVSEYANSASGTPPSVAAGGSYVISTGVFTPSTGATAQPSDPSSGEVIWERRATVNPQVDTGTVTLTSRWSGWFERPEDAAAALDADRAEAARDQAALSASEAQSSVGTISGLEELVPLTTAATPADWSLTTSGTVLPVIDLGRTLLLADDGDKQLRIEFSPEGPSSGIENFYLWQTSVRQFLETTEDSTNLDGAAHVGMTRRWNATTSITSVSLRNVFAIQRSVTGSTNTGLSIIVNDNVAITPDAIRYRITLGAYGREAAGGMGGASDFSELTGMIADGQVPDSFTRDSELPDVSGFQTQSQVDARIADYAKATPTGTIADAQIPSSIARDSEIPDTVPLAEAQEGSATTRRIWTSERVRQAILATPGYKGGYDSGATYQAGDIVSVDVGSREEYFIRHTGSGIHATPPQPQFLVGNHQ